MLIASTIACADAHERSAPDAAQKPPVARSKPYTFCVRSDGLDGLVFGAATKWNVALGRMAIYTRDCPADAFRVFLRSASTTLAANDYGFWSFDTSTHETVVEIAIGVDPWYQQAVMEHEFAHMLCGCAEHSDDPNSVAWPDVVGAMSNARILPSDVDRVNNATIP